MKPICFVVLLALLAPAVRAQPFDSLALAQGRQPSGTPGALTLRGVVVTANDVPLPRVRVAVINMADSGATLTLGLRSFSPAPPRGVLTDDRGQFTIQVPATASARLTFVKARYVAQS